ncbi:MAG: RtcB family protein [Actinobacteria bacterium]|nr:RtcB family protein [Actinomycetota bacterium]
MDKEIRRLSQFKWELPSGYKSGMRVPGTIFADEKLVEAARLDGALDQVANVAFLPGIVERSYAMPDIHKGYGFPIGGVAAFGEDGIVSPGGVGFDISCGVRLTKSVLTRSDVIGKIDKLADLLEANVPKGLGTRGKISAAEQVLKKVFKSGGKAALDLGYGREGDLEFTEGGGAYGGADPSCVGKRVFERGRNQLGTLGSGNHFVEVQFVEEIFIPDVAEKFGIFPDQVVVMIHSGSRGVGHQICTDYLQLMDRTAQKAGLVLPDRQLAYALLGSAEANDYLAALACAGNYAIANRQAIMHWVRESFEVHFKSPERKLGMDLLFDVSHNIAKMETHEVEGKQLKLCVHRKGATSSFPQGHKELPREYREVGQPVIIPGDMGSCSYVLVGTEESMKESFGSTCHGAGRTMSRSKAKKTIRGDELKKRLGDKGIIVRAEKMSLLAEEAPEAYKDVSRVVDICEGAGLSKKVAKLRPLAVLKG